MIPSITNITNSTNIVISPTYTTFNSFPNIPNNICLRVYYLEAPLSILGESIGIPLTNNLVEINGFHTGIGYQSVDKTQPYEFTTDYIISAGLTLNSLLPTIITTPNGRELVWKNQSEVTLGQYIDKDYWQRSTYITTINSSDLINIQNYINNTWKHLNPIYSLFSASKSTNSVDLFNPIMRPSICDTFCYDVIDYIKYNLKYCVDYATIPNISINSFIQNLPGNIVPIDFESNKEAIIDYYALFEEEISQIVDLETTLTEIIRLIQEAPADERDALIRLLQQELFTIIQLAIEAYESFDVIYYYGYHPNGSVGYWKITTPRLYIAYDRSNLKRNYPAIDINSKIVDDNNFDGLLCKSCVDIQTVDIQTVDMQTVEDNTYIYWWIVIIVIIILLIIIFCIILFR